MLTEVYKKDGVQLREAFGVSYPEYFIHPAAEYQALTKYTGVIDLTHWHILRVTGEDRVVFLNAMLTNDIAALGHDRGCHAVITTIKGKIVAELFVYARKNDVLVLIAQGDAAETLNVLNKHIISEDVTIEDWSASHGVLALEGPESEDVLWRVFPKGPFPKERFQAHARQFEESDIYLMGNSVSGEIGHHFLVPAADIERLRRYLVQACRGTDGLAVGRIAWNMKRVENGLPWFGVDFSDDNFPDEARLGATISYTKGCFRGQETLARLHHRGHVNRLLIGLITDDADVPATVRQLIGEFENEVNNYDEAGLQTRAQQLATRLDLGEFYPNGTELFAKDNDAKPIGWITSAVYSPRLRKPLVLAYVRYQQVENREPVMMDDQVLTLTDLPVLQPK